MMARAGLTLAAAALVLTGCAPIHEPRGFLGKLWHFEVGPDYEQPSVAMPDDFRGRVGEAEAASFADLPWWDVFADQALQRLVRSAVEGNYDLQAAVANIEQARAQVGIAAADLYPQVGYRGTAEREKLFVPGLPRTTFNFFQGGFNATWEIDVWGRIRRLTEAARAQYFATEEARRGIVVSLVSQVASAYFELLDLDRQLAIAHESAATYQHTLDVFTARYRGGTDTRISTSRAEANLQASLAQIAALERAIVQQEDAIGVLLGVNPQPIERGIPLVEQTGPRTPTGLTTDLLRRRPDIRQAEQTMIAANAEIGVAVANFFPTIGLSALYGNAGSKIKNVFKDGTSVWNILGNFSGPIFQGGRLVESYRAQRAFWDATIAQYRGTIVRAFSDVADALAAQVYLADQRAAQQRQVDALREAMQLSLSSYNVGVSTYLDVLDAEQQLYPAEIALAQTQRDQLLAVVNLYKALGGGWATPGASGPAADAARDTSSTPRPDA